MAIYHAKEGRANPRARRSRKRKRWGWTAAIVLLLVVAAIVGRALLPGFVREYINQAVERDLRYTGRVGEVRIHLWRGAYSVRNVRINKTSGVVPVPFFTAERVDFSIQWDALLDRRLVGYVNMQRPELNFVDHPDDPQTGEGAWLQMIQDLFPFTINQAIIRDGTIHFRGFDKENPMDVYISRIEGIVDNLTNIREETTPRVASVRAEGLVMDHASFQLRMTLNPFSYRPTFQLATRILDLDVTTINDLALAYGNFDFKAGWLDFVLEVEARDGQMIGYAKPLFRDLQVFSLREDLAEGNPIQFLWQALLGITTTLLENPARDQFGTLIPFTGDFSESTTVDILTTVGNVLRNAFIRAYLPQLEPGAYSPTNLEFQEVRFTDEFSREDLW
jgi:hypothetical protein